MLAAYVLGSAVKGTMRDDSDVDIALLHREGCELGARERLQLAAELEAAIGRTVDLGIVSSRNLIYASEVILTGTRFFTADLGATRSAETRLLGNYVMFREDRRLVEEAYSAA